MKAPLPREPDGIVIKFRGGIVKLPFSELSRDVQKKYGYDAQAAAAAAENQRRFSRRPERLQGPLLDLAGCPPCAVESVHDGYRFQGRIRQVR